MTERKVKDQQAQEEIARAELERRNARLEKENKIMAEKLAEALAVVKEEREAIARLKRLAVAMKEALIKSQMEAEA